jgi:hypothetical protein
MTLKVEVRLQVVLQLLVAQFLQVQGLQQDPVTHSMDGLLHQLVEAQLLFHTPIIKLQTFLYLPNGVR